MAEIAAKREVELSRQLAAEQVGLRTAEKDKNVGVANEQASQQVKVQQRETAAKEMDVVQVKNVRGAEISREVAVIAAAQAKEVAIVQADAAKQVAIVGAEGQKQQTVLTAEGQLEAARRNAEGIAVEGNAKGSAETAILMAPVDAQIKLAEKIGADKGYQEYLLGIRNIEAALHEAGCTLADVLRVRYLLPERADFEPCWPVLRRHFGPVRPAATMLVCGLADPRMKIEIEVDARVPAPR